LEEVEPELGAAIVQDLDPEVAADILEEMEPSAATDLFREVSEERQEDIKGRMEKEEWQEISLLKTFKEKTAGSLMTTEYLSMPGKATVQEALDLIRKSAGEVEILHYVFVVDDQERLTGTVGLRKLLTSPLDTPLRQLASQRIISVGPEEEWESVAELFYKYSFLALPVVDKEGKLLGIIGFKHSFDELVSYYYKEAS
jgi:Mg/Co/Ni transporter MgtE